MYVFVIVLIVLAVLVAAVLVIAGTKASDFVIKRSSTMKAPPEKIFPLVNDFKNWTSWSPYEKLDPNLKRTISGPPAGKGAVYEWEGNSKAGQGRMEILESTSPRKVRIDLRFMKPFRANHVAEFTFEPSPTGTNVTWAMSGRHAFMGKVMCVFMNMDKFVGKDFETGLANMKSLSEK